MDHSKLLLAYLNDSCDRIDAKLSPLNFRRQWWKTGVAASMALGVAVTLGGCGSESGDPAGQSGDATADDALTDTEDNLAKADGVSNPHGTYQNKGSNGDLALLIVNADKSFTADLLAGSSLAGTYKFTKGGTTQYIRMVLTDGTIVRYAYTLTTTTIKLRKVGTSTTFSMYAIKEDCKDGIDNDFDGAVDCGDSDCSGQCGVKYGIPYESNCTDGVDNDFDGTVDCADPDCASAPSCGGTKYGIPYEIDCKNGIDDDGDGLVDCSDGDCAGSSSCVGTKYGIPFPSFETDCTNGLDDDNDGTIDCLDTDCATVPSCMGAKYAAPQN